jgi:hypothetical protein
MKLNIVNKTARETSLNLNAEQVKIYYKFEKILIYCFNLKYQGLKFQI